MYIHLPALILRMGPTAISTKASEPESNSYHGTAHGMKLWQTVLEDKVTRILHHQKDCKSSWWQDSLPTKIDLELTKAVLDRCDSLIAFANPNQTPEGFASTFAEVQAAKKKVCDTEGYEGLINGERWGLDNAEDAIQFGAMAHICSSVDGLGAPIFYNDKTVVTESYQSSPK